MESPGLEDKLTLARDKFESEYDDSTPADEDALYRHFVCLLLTPEQQKNELWVKSIQG